MDRTKEDYETGDLTKLVSDSMKILCNESTLMRADVPNANYE
jgi:hypothetical protein